jgi:hypothetical protein
MRQLKADLGQLRTDLNQSRSDAQTQYSAEIEATRGAVNQFAASVAAARATLDARTLRAVGTAVSGVQESMRHLTDAMSGTC